MAWRSWGRRSSTPILLRVKWFAPGTPGLERIVASFGNDMLNENGSLNRSGLRERVFADPQDRKLLEAITHPLIEGEVKARIAAADQADYIVLVVPLLVESGLFSDADKVVVVGRA